LSGRKALQFLTLKELITRSFKLPSDYVADLKRSATAVYCHEVYFGFKSAAAELNSIVETSVKSTALTIANPSSAVKPIVSPSSDIIAKFKSMANSVHGSGFVWLVKEKSSEKLSVIATRNTETPNLNLLTPILCIDMWEHAYFLQYKYMRSDYINYFTKMALN
jgi:Fe-Mn family superoxide dismutase